MSALNKLNTSDTVSLLLEDMRRMRSLGGTFDLFSDSSWSFVPVLGHMQMTFDYIKTRIDHPNRSRPN